MGKRMIKKISPFLKDSNKAKGNLDLTRDYRTLPFHTINSSKEENSTRFGSFHL